MKTPALSFTLLAAAELALASDISQYSTSPFLTSRDIPYDDTPRPLELRQNGTEYCRTFPGDADWPTDADWSALNATVGGALIKPVPRAAVCHLDWPAHYDEEKCKALIAEWNDYDQRVAHPTDLIYVYFQGTTCLPTLDAASPCTPGGVPAYVVNVTRPAQISAAIAFARDRNVRLVIKNTGHDVSGKSTAAGALSIWTHHLKGIEWMPDFAVDRYRGPAFRVGAGVTLGELYQAAEDHDVTAVGGECSVRLVLEEVLE